MSWQLTLIDVLHSALNIHSQVETQRDRHHGSCMAELGLATGDLLQAACSLVCAAFYYANNSFGRIFLRRDGTVCFIFLRTQLPLSRVSFDWHGIRTDIASARISHPHGHCIRTVLTSAHDPRTTSSHLSTCTCSIETTIIVPLHLTTLTLINYNGSRPVIVRALCE